MERGNRQEVQTAREIVAAHGRGQDKVALHPVRRGPHQNGGPKIEVPVVFTQHKLLVRTGQDRKECYGLSAFGLGILPYSPGGFYTAQ